MYRLKKREMWASEIAQYLNAELVGEDVLIGEPRAIRTPSTQGGLPSRPETDPALLLIAHGSVPPETGTSYIVSENPDLDLAYVLLEFFTGSTAHTIHQTAQISENAVIGRNVMVGANSVIGDDVEIGDDTRILNNVVIHGPAQIGEDCVIKDGAVIGSEGYRFVKDEQDRLVHPPQLGRILIGDRVWVGANSTIERAMINDTIIEDDAKIDDLVHLGNGSRVGRKSLLTAGCTVAFDVVIGEEVTVAPNATIRHSVTIASHITVGQGAVVVNDLTSSGVYVGVPAKRLEK